MKSIFTLVFTHIITLTIFSQNIGGVINKYANVVEIDYCKNSLSIPSSLGSQFNIGDKILIIQMKGALLIDGNNSSTGEIDDYRNAGNYEINEIKSISSTSTFNISLKYEFESSFTTSGFVQIVSVPQYEDVVVTNTLTCQNWNGSYGGILVFDANGSVTLDANIDVSGAGFRGGEVENLNSSCFGGTGFPGYNCAYSSDCGAKKGEGVGSGYETEELAR